MAGKIQDTEYEQAIISAIICDPVVYSARVKASGIDSFAFVDVNFQKVFRYIEDIMKKGYTPNYKMVKGSIETDSGTDNKAKITLVKTLDDCKRLDYDLFDISMDVISKKRKKDILFSSSKLIYDSLTSGTDPDKVIELLLEKIKLGKNNSIAKEQENRDYFEDWSNRRQERVAATLSNNRAIKFHGWLEDLNKYFPRGIETGTITTIGGVTGVGKSILLANFIYMAIHPTCGLSGIYVIAENKYSQAAARLDSLMMDVNYNKLFEPFDEENKDEDDLFFDTAIQEGWGNLRCIKLIPQTFTAADLELKIEEFENIYSKKPDFIFIDSPDHMEPIFRSQVKHENKGQVYWDIKSLITTHDMICITSLPLTKSSSKKESMDAEDAAGSYDISRISDNQIFFLKRADDFKLGKRAIQFVKLRDSEIDSNIMDLKITPSLRLVKFSQFLSADGVSVTNNNPNTSTSIQRFLKAEDVDAELKKAADLFESKSTSPKGVFRVKLKDK